MTDLLSCLFREADRPATPNPLMMIEKAKEASKP